MGVILSISSRVWFIQSFVLVFMDFMDTEVANQGSSTSFQKGGTEGVFQSQGQNTSQLPWEGLRKGTGQEGSTTSGTQDSRGPVQFLSRNRKQFFTL